MSCCCWVTSQLAGSVAAATASAYAVSEVEAITTVTRVDGSDGTVMGDGSKYRHARSAGSVTVYQVPG